MVASLQEVQSKSCPTWWLEVKASEKPLGNQVSPHPRPSGLCTFPSVGASASRHSWPLNGVQDKAGWISLA